MAFQDRRGLEADFQPNKMLPGERATLLDTKKVYHTFAPGDCRRLATHEEMTEMIDESVVRVKDNFTAELVQALDNAEIATDAANQINADMVVSEVIREQQEEDRQSNTATVIADAGLAIDRAINAAESAESLVVNKAGINDIEPTLTEAYSGAKTQELYADAKSYAGGLFAYVTSFLIEVVAELPTENIGTHTIYLLPKTAETNDNYDEYMYINSAWEHIGSTSIDLSNYYTKAEIDSKDTNLVNAVEEVTSELATLIAELHSEFSTLQLAYFKNKSICVIGDSISDDSTYQPNWVDSFRTLVATVDATVTNASITGSSLVGFAQDMNLVPAGHDIYIIALGVNDFQGQFTLNDIRNAMVAFASKCNTATSDVYYSSPIKTYGDDRITKYTPLGIYRTVLERIASTLGFRVISGYNMPKLYSSNQTTWLADTLHPASVFAPIFCSYVIKGILSGVSTFSHFSSYKKSCALLVTNTGGSITFTWLDNGLAKFEINLVGMSLIAGWNDIATVGTSASNKGMIPSLIECGTFIDKNTGKAYQIRFVDNKVQMYSQGSATISPFGMELMMLPIDSTPN